MAAHRVHLIRGVGDVGSSSFHEESRNVWVQGAWPVTPDQIDTAWQRAFGEQIASNNRSNPPKFYADTGSYGHNRVFRTAIVTTSRFDTPYLR